MDGWKEGMYDVLLLHSANMSLVFCALSLYVFRI